MLHIGICDDEIEVRDALHSSLEHILRSEENKVFYEFSSGEGIVKWISRHPDEMDILFLDIELKGISGMEAAKLIRQHDSKLLIVFVTGYADFVFDGYSVQAMDYIVKPIKEDKLYHVIKNAKNILENQKPQTFIVQNTDGIYKIFKKDILYFYSDKRLVKLVTKEHEYAFYGKLDEVQKQLGSGFIRIHQRYLVRGNAVLKVEKSSITIGDKCLPISRSMHKSAIMALAQIMLGEEN